MKRAFLIGTAMLLTFVLAAAPALAYTKLEKGMEGSEVLSMQLALKSLGYSIEADGKYGNATVSVVKSFQRQHGLTADGVAGSQTLTLLYSLAPSFRPTSFAPTAAPTVNPWQLSGGETATVITTGGSLNLREAATSSARVITTIPYGEKVVVVQRGNTWASVIYNGVAGYVMTQYLYFGSAAPTAVPTAAPTAAPAGIQAMVVTTGGSLNLRETATTDGRVIATIPYGTWVTVTSRGSVWCAVAYQGLRGYVMTSFLYFGNAAPTTVPTVAPTAVPTAAPAGTQAMVVTTGGSLNLRETATSDGRVIATIPYGAWVTVTSRGSVWCAVAYQGLRGYVMTSFLYFGNAAPTTVPTAAPAAVQAMVVTSGGSLNLRETPSGDGRILAFIPYGTWVTVTARGSVWSAVIYQGQMGYVMSQYLSFGAALPTVSPSPTPTSAPITFGETAYVSTAGGTLNLREAASSTARVVAVIPNGAVLNVLSRGSLWCAVSYQGVAGYVMTDFLRFPNAQQTAVPTAVPTISPAQIPTWSPGGAQAQIAYVTTTGGSLNLRAEAGSGAKVLCTIPNGTALAITERGTIWCKTSYNGNIGYVMTSFLTFSGTAAATQSPVPTAAPTPETGAVGSAIVTTSGGAVNLRAAASTGAKVLATVPNAGIVTVTSRGTDWSAVTYNGISGYMMNRYLTFLSGNTTPTQQPGAEEDDPSAFTRILKKGMTGADVTWVQNRLQELGYSVDITNVYDDATFSAVKAFQTQNGLTADGMAGSQTFALLKSDSARRAGSAPLTYSTLRIDDTGDGVRQLQSDLKALGYPVTVNGTYDTDTHNAVVAFQQRSGLVISGIADALTRQTLHGGGGKPYSTPVDTLPANEGWIQGPSVSQMKLLHWQNDIKPNVKAGQTFTVFDPNTHLSWKLVFYSLGRHADCQPASWRDTQIMNRSFGSTSWTIHPVYVQLPSGQWTMATMHNRPHLYGTIADNGFGGHLCVHFLRDMAEAQKNDPNYGVNNQVTLRNAWKALTGQTVE